MIKTRYYLALFANLLISGVFAERVSPTEVEPIHTDEAIYLAPHNSTYGKDAPGGIIEARNPKSGELLWWVRVYKATDHSDLEQDVQPVYIVKTSLDEAHQLLIISDEEKRIFALDLRSKEVTQIKSKKLLRTPRKYTGPEESEQVTTKEIIRILEHGQVIATTTAHSGHITIWLKNGKRYDGVFVAAEAAGIFSKMGASNVVAHFLENRPADEVDEWRLNAEME